MSGMLSRQSFLLHSSLLPWKLFESRPQMMLPKVHFAAHQSRFAKDISFQDFGPHNFGREHNCNLDRVELEEWEAKRLITIPAEERHTRPDEHTELDFQAWSIRVQIAFLRGVSCEGSQTGCIGLFDASKPQNFSATKVMKAINTNSARALRKAIAIAPRNKRATELLNITVGTQSISPFYWAIDSGRDKYYYGVDELFTRHPEVIQRLCNSAPNLLWTLLDGLVWRSRQAFNGKRRVNFYDIADDNFSRALEWLVERNDPKIICHSAVVLFADLLWTRMAQYDFLLGRCYFLFCLCVLGLHERICPINSDLFALQIRSNELEQSGLTTHTDIYIYI
ncbi:unnamed protein product [Cladocopium goreaui]|uniref:Pentatricopeptide repeat-containing protein, chloroplastic n=1 Tax=Cladocopium goreaui TaxID=2562237 RepID=A0A9P1DTL8_9DINO|nr:unnamed protein product [Cladocopium goreaui]